MWWVGGARAGVWGQGPGLGARARGLALGLSCAELRRSRRDVAYGGAGLGGRDGTGEDGQEAENAVRCGRRDKGPAR